MGLYGYPVYCYATVTCYSFGIETIYMSNDRLTKIILTGITKRKQITGHVKFELSLSHTIKDIMCFFFFFC